MISIALKVQWSTGHEDYPDITKLSILGDVAPYLREYNRIRAIWCESLTGNFRPQDERRHSSQTSGDRIVHLRSVAFALPFCIPYLAARPITGARATCLPSTLTGEPLSADSEQKVTLHCTPKLFFPARLRSGSTLASAGEQGLALLVRPAAAFAVLSLQTSLAVGRTQSRVGD